MIGVNPLDSNLNPKDDKADEIKEELQSVYFETTAVKRTFSDIGFKKGKLPLDVFASISAYYYNNINHFTNEEQVSRSVFVNYWQAPCYFLGMPWGLKKLWQKKLLKLVQAWVGDQTPLETSDIYGIRAYSDGARLLSHVDRITTHAVSLIINVAQVNVLEPWFVEIYDFAGRLHEIEMQPGEVVYYESARCLHGRMRPLNGSRYVNIFSHYRPVGDDRWYQKPNPPGTPEPLINIGTCVLDQESASPTCEGAHLPTLSPSLETLKDGSDLFKWWQKVSLPRDPAEAGRTTAHDAERQEL